MATYKEIQRWVKDNYGFSVKTCWIAHVKEMCGLKLRRPPNRLSQETRSNPCPPDKIEPIELALKSLGKIWKRPE